MAAARHVVAENRAQHPEEDNLGRQHEDNDEDDDDRQGQEQVAHAVLAGG